MRRPQHKTPKRRSLIILGTLFVLLLLLLVQMKRFKDIHTNNGPGRQQQHLSNASNIADAHRNAETAHEQTNAPPESGTARKQKKPSDGGSPASTPVPTTAAPPTPEPSPTPSEAPCDWVRKSKIPPRMISIWKTKKLFDEPLQLHNEWLEKEPCFERRIVTDDECRYLSSLHPGLKKHYDALPMNVMRADVCRILAVYFYGGIYMDLDVAWKEPLRNWFNTSTDLLLGHEKEDGSWYCNWFFGASRKHQCMKHVLDTIRTKINRHWEKEEFEETKWIVHKTTGPEVFAEALKECGAVAQLSREDVNSVKVRHMYASQNWRQSKHYSSWTEERAQLAGWKSMFGMGLLPKDVRHYLMRDPEELVRSYVSPFANKNFTADHPLGISTIGEEEEEEDAPSSILLVNHVVSNAIRFRNLQYGNPLLAIDNYIESYFQTPSEGEHFWEMELAEPLRIIPCAPLNTSRSEKTTSSSGKKSSADSAGALDGGHNDEENSGTERKLLAVPAKRVIDTTTKRKVVVTKKPQMEEEEDQEDENVAMKKEKMAKKKKKQASSPKSPSKKDHDDAPLDEETPKPTVKTSAKKIQMRRKKLKVPTNETSRCSNETLYLSTTTAPHQGGKHSAATQPPHHHKDIDTLFCVRFLAPRDHEIGRTAGLNVRFIKVVGETGQEVDFDVWRQDNVSLTEGGVGWVFPRISFDHLNFTKTNVIDKIRFERGGEIAIAEVQLFTDSEKCEEYRTLVTAEQLHKKSMFDEPPSFDVYDWTGLTQKAYAKMSVRTYRCHHLKFFGEMLDDDAVWPVCSAGEVSIVNGTMAGVDGNDDGEEDFHVIHPHNFSTVGEEAPAAATPAPMKAQKDSKKKKAPSLMFNGTVTTKGDDHVPPVGHAVHLPLWRNAHAHPKGHLLHRAAKPLFLANHHTNMSNTTHHPGQHRHRQDREWKRPGVITIQKTFESYLEKEFAELGYDVHSFDPWYRTAGKEGVEVTQWGNFTKHGIDLQTDIRAETNDGLMHLKQMMEVAKIDHIAILKLNRESKEWFVIDSIIELVKAKKLDHLMIEMHVCGGYGDWNINMAKHMSMAMDRLHEYFYLIGSRQNNRGSIENDPIRIPCCVKATFMRKTLINGDEDDEWEDGEDGGAEDDADQS